MAADAQTELEDAYLELCREAGADAAREVCNALTEAERVSGHLHWGVLAEMEGVREATRLAAWRRVERARDALVREVVEEQLVGLVRKMRRLVGAYSHSSLVVGGNAGVGVAPHHPRRVGSNDADDHDEGEDGNDAEEEDESLHARLGPFPRLAQRSPSEQRLAMFESDLVMRYSLAHQLCASRMGYADQDEVLALLAAWTSFPLIPARRLGDLRRCGEDER